MPPCAPALRRLDASPDARCADRLPLIACPGLQVDSALLNNKPYIAALRFYCGEPDGCCVPDDIATTGPLQPASPAPAPVPAEAAQADETGVGQFSSSEWYGAPPTAALTPYDGGLCPCDTVLHVRRSLYCVAVWRVGFALQVLFQLQAQQRQVASAHAHYRRLLRRLQTWIVWNAPGAAGAAAGPLLGVSAECVSAVDGATVPVR